MPSDERTPVTYLILLADGLHNFIGGLAIAASDLIPEVKHDRVLANNLLHFAAFLAGVLVILLTRLAFER